MEDQCNALFMRALKKVGDEYSKYNLDRNDVFENTKINHMVLNNNLNEINYHLNTIWLHTISGDLSFGVFTTALVDWYNLQIKELEVYLGDAKEI
jgi:hypothetical protein